MKKTCFGRRMLPAFALILVIPVADALAQQTSARAGQTPGQLTFEEIMKFEELRQPVISANGTWIAYAVWPERGDGEVRILPVAAPARGARRGAASTPASARYIIERGERPQISSDGKWVGAIVQAPFIERENATGNDRPRAGLAVLNTSDGTRADFTEVQNFEFSNNSRWLVVRHQRPRDLDASARKNRNLGTPVTLRDLETGEQQQFGFVNASAMDSTGQHFVFAVSDTSGANALYHIDLRSGLSETRELHGGEFALYDNLVWDHARLRTTFTLAFLETSNEYRPSDVSIAKWRVGAEAPVFLLNPGEIDENYRLRNETSLSWSPDGNRLFFGLLSAEMVALDEIKEPKDSLTTENLFDIGRILRGVEGDVWHWNDPLIKTHEKNTWERRKNHQFMAVMHIGAAGENVGESGDGQIYIQLGTFEVPEVTVTGNPHVVLGRSNLPYQQLITWDGTYHDHYIIDLNTGSREKIIEKLRYGASLSAGGRFVTWFDEDHWHLLDRNTGERVNLTEALNVPFANEENDRPMPSPGYGVAGWIGNDDALLLYDKFDIWQFDLTGGPASAPATAQNLTKGRETHRIYRIRDVHPDRVTFSSGEALLLEMYNDRHKNSGYYRLSVGQAGVERLLEEEMRYQFLAHAPQQGGYLFTKENYDLYPNLWFSRDGSFREVHQQTNLHHDLKQRYAWGHAELISWLNLDGREVQGVLIYPGNYEPGKRYPVLVYYYERFSQRLHQFDQITNNHRPVFAQYTSDGYAVFLPDVWFDVPLPGYSATKNLVPGVQKLIEMGVADPAAIGLHGHSWSGYLTAHVITQTDIFAAAVAGAPVSNMTSAYSGIRWGSGLARQFQYEQTQSRLGVSMYENHLPYIENSPVFYASRINTPLLIQFGDIDDAVPWEQGIELYLAMRRLGKDSVFLQYRGERHHLRSYANRLDYAIKMKEYFDHYLRGAPAPDWITTGVPYLGR